MSQYAGANWIERNFKCEMSPLGIAVADFLGDVFQGIYHLDSKALSRVEWDNNHHITFSLGWRALSTVDYNELTVMVILAHDRALRLQIEASTHKYLRLMFHQRKREGGYAERCPTLEEHIELIRSHF